MTTNSYELTDGEVMRCVASVIDNPELTDLVEKGWWA